MQPIHAIVCSTVGALLLAVLASLVTTDGKAVAPPAMCGAFEEAAYMCNLPKQDRTPAAALLHCATGEGMLLAARASCRTKPSFSAVALTHNESSSGARPSRRRP